MVYPEWISEEAVMIMKKASIINIKTMALQIGQYSY